MQNSISAALLEYFPHLVEVPCPSGLHNLHGKADFCFQDVQLKGALTCTAEEGAVLNRIVSLANPEHMLEIGSYVGWSTAHLLYGNTCRITCVDPFTELSAKNGAETSQETMHRFRDNMWRAGMAYRISLWVEPSPDILSYVAPKDGWDLVFIDGWHFDNQPTYDIHGVLPHITANAIVILHDFWMADVVEAGRRLSTAGWFCTEIETANRLAVFTKRKPEWWDTFLGEL